MKVSGKIITIGLSPAWDITCRGKGLDWGLHKDIDEQIIRPAGKALNISRALAWMGEGNIVAGLWGQQDYPQMLEALAGLKGLVKIRFTAATGRTRQNITVVDMAIDREMHLRCQNKLASLSALRKLKMDLQAVVNRNSVCVFAGAMPEAERLGEVVRIVKTCLDRRAKIVLDTSGAALRRIIDIGDIWLIKPNVQELCELLGQQIKDDPVSLVKAGTKLLEKVEIVLISRSRKGAIAVTRKGAWQGQCTGRRRVLATVGCGDYLLAGFLKGLKDKSHAGAALQTALKVATAKAWGWTDKMLWLDVQGKTKVQVGQM